eukprot:TRINITY_DN1787_c0_g1_i1.p1 TRINITY_DN1787_c0_g1~~TRINITY_DN1787_c0_g1_i1.p1  ORF type:complete len:981 (-),score=216.63 TRINITY_DN1787_c0_g1_i1:233-3175(-)
MRNYVNYVPYPNFLNYYIFFFGVYEVFQLLRFIGIVFLVKWEKYAAKCKQQEKIFDEEHLNSKNSSLSILLDLTCSDNVYNIRQHERRIEKLLKAVAELNYPPTDSKIPIYVILDNLHGGSCESYPAVVRTLMDRLTERFALTIYPDSTEAIQHVTSEILVVLNTTAFPHQDFLRHAEECLLHASVGFALPMYLLVPPENENGVQLEVNRIAAGVQRIQSISTKVDELVRNYSKEFSMRDGTIGAWRTKNLLDCGGVLRPEEGLLPIHKLHWKGKKVRQVYSMFVYEEMAPTFTEFSEEESKRLLTGMGYFWRIATSKPHSNTLKYTAAFRLIAPLLFYFIPFAVFAVPLGAYPADPILRHDFLKLFLVSYILRQFIQQVVAPKCNAQDLWLVPLLPLIRMGLAGSVLLHLRVSHWKNSHFRLLAKWSKKILITPTVQIFALIATLAMIHHGENHGVLIGSMEIYYILYAFAASYILVIAGSFAKRQRLVAVLMVAGLAVLACQFYYETLPRSETFPTTSPLVHNQIAAFKEPNGWERCASKVGPYSGKHAVDTRSHIYDDDMISIAECDDHPAFIKNQGVGWVMDRGDNKLTGQYAFIACKGQVELLVSMPPNEPRGRLGLEDYSIDQLSALVMNLGWVPNSQFETSFDDIHEHINVINGLAGYSFDNYYLVGDEFAMQEIPLWSGCQVNKVSSNEDTTWQREGMAVYGDVRREGFLDTKNRMSCYDWSKYNQTQDVKKDLFLWNRMQQQNYTTMYAEHACSTKDDNHPAHFFNQRGGLDFEKWYGNFSCDSLLEGEKMPVCFGKQLVHQQLLRYLEELWEGHDKKRLVYADFSGQEGSQEEKYLASLGEDLWYFFISWATHNTMVHKANTVVILKGDAIRKETQYSYEDSSASRPALKIFVPVWLVKENSSIKRNLEVNSRRMITPYDLYATLASLEDLNNPAPRYVPPWSYNILQQEIPATRTCEEARIPRKFCKSG